MEESCVGNYLNWTWGPWGRREVAPSSFLSQVRPRRARHERTYCQAPQREEMGNHHYRDIKRLFQFKRHIGGGRGWEDMMALDSGSQARRRRLLL